MADLAVIRVEALVVAFGWEVLADRTSAELSRNIVEILDDNTLSQELEIRQLVIPDENVGRAMPPGNRRNYTQTRINYRQFRVDLESVMLVHSMS